MLKYNDVTVSARDSTCWELGCASGKIELLTGRSFATPEKSGSSTLRKYSPFNADESTSFAVVVVALVAQTAGHSAELNVIEFSTLRKF